MRLLLITLCPPYFMGTRETGRNLLNPGKIVFAGNFRILLWCVCGLSWSPEVKRTYIWTAQCHITGPLCYSAPWQVRCLQVLWATVETSIYVSVGNSLILARSTWKRISRPFLIFEFKWQAERWHLFTCNWTGKGPAKRKASQLVFQNTR